MDNYHTEHTEFIDFATKVGLLKFGDYQLKSGRKSPYFMDVGVFFNGEGMRTLGNFYAAVIRRLSVDVLFGPAYKGIPLASAAVMSLTEKNDPNLSCIFDRKEKKDHGEGGHLIGKYESGARCLIIDDVLTAGTAARHSVKLLKATGLKPVGLLVLIDREELAEPNGQMSAAESLEADGIKVYSIAKASDIVRWLNDGPNDQAALAEPIRNHLREYGAPSCQELQESALA